MAVLSMTGYGKAVAELNNKKLVVEIKSLNSKSFDLSLRLASSVRDKELELRSNLSKILDRGKVDVAIYFENSNVEASSVINKTLVKSYFAELKAMAAELGDNTSNLLELALKMPDVLKPEAQVLEEVEWEKINVVLMEAITAFQGFRSMEGEKLRIDMMEHVTNIATHLDAVIEHAPARIAQIKTNLETKLNEIKERINIDQNRLEQELIYYIEKLDVNEEQVRLKSHLQYFEEAMKESNCGRKLNFITQEMGREINTIGSKANNSVIQKLVVQMKDELEKIKEQTNNVL